jgi:hypothetical protein
MAISYTTNFNWPMSGDAGENWGAIWNGVVEDLDIEVKAAQNPIVLTTGEIVISMRLGGAVILRHYQ